jgi:RNA polymerase sigma-70 factor (ECF subfamily)
VNWEKIWRDCWREIYLFIFYRVQNRQDAEDITQETFMKAIKAQERYKEKEVNIIALLKSIARNIIIDKWRSTNKNKSTVPIQDISLINELEKGIEERYIDHEHITYLLSFLKDEQYRIINYRLIQGYSIKETAEMIGKNETYVKVTQYRAIEFIKNQLKKERMEG